MQRRIIRPLFQPAKAMTISPVKPRVERPGGAVMPQIMDVEVAALIVNRDPRRSIARCRRTTAG
jgi:hypothetical protein